jgi:hypothetical protein
MAFQSTTKFLPSSSWFLGSLQFIIDKFGDLSLQEPESREVIRSGTGHLPPASVWVGLINEAQLRCRLSELRKTDLDPAGHKADHTLAVLAVTTDSIYQSSPKSNFDDDGEVYMVGSREELPEKTDEEIQQEADEEIAHIPCLAREAEKWKRHNGLQDESSMLDDEPRDGTPMRRHHLKFNSQRQANRVWLWNRSQSIRVEIGRIEY